MAVAGGVGLFAFFYFLNPLSLTPEASKVMAVAVMMLAWWLSEALPMPLVASVPLVLFPVLNVMKMEQAAASYGSSIVFLFLGGFMLGLAIEKWNLHRRIALSIVKNHGADRQPHHFGVLHFHGFLSMWLSNTATTMMMFPIAASVVTLMEHQRLPGGKPRKFCDGHHAQHCVCIQYRRHCHVDRYAAQRRVSRFDRGTLRLRSGAFWTGC